MASDETPVNYSRHPAHKRPPTQIPRRPVKPAYEHPDPLLSLSREVTYTGEKWRPTHPVHAHGAVDQSPDSQTHKKLPLETQKRRPSIFWWHLEILSLVAAVVCLGSIVVVLLFYDGKPLSSWPSSIITLNGLIALLSTLHRTFLMVSVSSVLSQAKWGELSSRRADSGQTLRLGNFALFEYASQGLGGCFQILWRFKGCHTACIGALLTITSLVFGFFSQQLINTRIETVASRVSTDAGDVLRTTYIEGGSGASQRPVMDLSTKVSILNGFVTNTTVDPPQANCATGNCTWPIIPTLGVCGACVNLTDTIVMEEKNSTARDGESIPCLATAKGGTQLDGCDFEFEIFKVSPGTGQVFDAGKAPIKRNSSLVIGELAAIKSDKWDEEQNRSAAECAFWYCLQARNVSVKNGVLKDDIVDTWTEHTDDVVPEFVNVPKEFNTASEEFYGIGFFWWDTVQTYWNTTVSGNVTTSLRNIVNGGDGNFFSDSMVAEGLMHNFGDFDDWAVRFAESMTNPLRSTRLTTEVPPEGEESINREAEGIRQREEYRGIAWDTQVTITVRWGWIAYPAAVLLLASTYLAIELVRSARAEGIRPWRNDPLVTLFMNVDDELKHAIRPALEHPMGVSHVAGDRRMLVIRDEYGIPVGFRAKTE